ncbi:LysR family transcriptional regulator [Pseudonocardia sp. DSM 110487]|uniref:LysR family transcriptional regulator n=1 Tax=Pseudonocardia sp. DSM 110487 TaxID=2865833 RepID=UPI001C695636|nr:LysR family transcriptional regulator [Pseudonocardia sp. DSM 110487]QYN37929.1 LysR family transcriptional regulator [Pseudonocardia sp. DSM 110487]
MVEIREIEALIAVAEELHFGRAAARLRLATATVSHTIRGLERRVGGRLFERTSRRVRLTPLGEQLVGDVRPAHEQLRRAFAEARQAAAARTRELLIGFSRSIPPSLIEAVRVKVEKMQPGTRIVQVDVTQLDVLQYQKRVGLGLDAVVGWFPPGTRDRPATGMRAGPIIALDEPAVLIHPAHPLACSSPLNIEQLTDLTFIDVTGMESMSAPWVPYTTPAGRPIEREHRDLRYNEELFVHLVREHGRLAHLTTQGLSAAWPLGELVLVPVDGWKPFEARTMWPATAETSAIKQFAQLAGSIGRGSHQS